MNMSPDTTTAASSSTADIHDISDALDAWTSMMDLSVTIGSFSLEKKIELTRERQRKRSSGLDLPQDSVVLCENHHGEGEGVQAKKTRISATSSSVDEGRSINRTQILSLHHSGPVGSHETSSDNDHRVSPSFASTSGYHVGPFPRDASSNKDDVHADSDEHQQLKSSFCNDVAKIRRMAALLVQIKAAHAAFRDDIIALLVEKESGACFRDQE